VYDNLMTLKIPGRINCYAKNSIDNDSNPQQYLVVNVPAVHRRPRSNL